MPGDGVVLWGIGTVRTHRPQWLARELGIDYELRLSLGRFRGTIKLLGELHMASPGLTIDSKGGTHG